MVVEELPSGFSGRGSLDALKNSLMSATNLVSVLRRQCERGSVGLARGLVEGRRHQELIGSLHRVSGFAQPIVVRACDLS